MIKKIKERFYSLIKDLEYNITDNGTYNEKFPWLMLRLGNATKLNSFDLKVDAVSLTLDIFSTYNGELEIIDIVENINNNLQSLVADMPELLYAYQKTFKILDDKSTGPVKKHGVVVFDFLLGQSQKEVNEDDIVQ